MTREQVNSSGREGRHLFGRYWLLETYAEYARHEALGGFRGDLLRGLITGPVVDWRWHIERYVY